MRVFLIILFCMFILTLARRQTYKNGGTYRYVNKNTGKTHYVGATNDFNRRHAEHKRADYYASSSNYKYVTNNMPNANKQQVAHEERRQINQYKPSANRNRGGGGL